MFSSVIDGRKHWGVMAALLVFPITAVLHHLVFFRGMCMLNRIGEDYTIPVIALWLSRDPSLPIACAIALAIFFAGRRFDVLRRLAAPVLFATIPLTIWIWDIPFTGRIICHSFHDGRLRIGDTPFATRWLYLLSALIYAGLLIWRQRAAPTPS
jgi:hypothetical protein